MEISPNVDRELSKQIDSCYELLGDEYVMMDYTIHVYLSQEELEKEHVNNPVLSNEAYEQILHGRVVPPGQTFPDGKTIRLYAFNLSDISNDNLRKLEFVANLFHEVRHAWQFTYGKFLAEESIEDIDNNLKKYFNLPSERDAYLFQEQQVNRHSDDIVRIMGMTQGFKNYKIKDEISLLMD